MDIMSTTTYKGEIFMLFVLDNLSNKVPVHSKLFTKKVWLVDFDEELEPVVKRRCEIDFIELKNLEELTEFCFEFLEVQLSPWDSTQEVEGYEGKIAGRLEIR